MTATVIPLLSRDRNQPPACDCHSHRLVALANRLRCDLAGSEGELLISREQYAGAVADALSTIDGIAASTLPDYVRTTR